MRRSGSSSCLLRPKGETILSPNSPSNQNKDSEKSYSSIDSINSNDENATDFCSNVANTSGISLAPIQVPLDKQPSVTMVTTHRLPSYSVERYWALSEIDQFVDKIYFLSEFDGANEIEGTSFSSPFIILYLLWRPHELSSDEKLVEFIDDALKKVHSRMQYSNSNPDVLDSDLKLEIYLVVDKISVPLPLSGGSSLLEVDHLLETQAAVRFARLAASNSKLRGLLSGISIGVTDQVRAAPGLVEGVLSILSYGSRERRAARKLRPDHEGIGKSLITIIAMNEKDFIGLDPKRETDAAQGIDQSVIRAEWNGQGDHLSFASRAHAVWRKKSNDEFGLYLSSIDTDISLFSVERMSTILAVTVAILSFAHIWNTFHNSETV